MLSKSKIDKVGKILVEPKKYTEEQVNNAYELLSQYRMEHLKPLTELNLRLREWLMDFSKDYYIAQRLKRTPRIIEKLRRLKTLRLSQLQDIGGCRIIVENYQVQEELFQYIINRLAKSKVITIYGNKKNNPVDYRERGRDDSGYRAIHIILKVREMKIELQIRSNMQHYWAESIERTSIIYQKNIKSLQGDPIVIQYFKTLSDIFFEIECNRNPTITQKNDLDELKIEAEKIIKNADSYKLLNSNVNENFIQHMKARVSKSRYRKIYNWLLIFNWKTGEFQNWILLEKTKPEEIAKEYEKNEKSYSVDYGYEVVVIGASSVETIRHTHSHYFGVQNYDKVLAGFDDTLISFKKRKDINSTSRFILYKLVTNRKWGKSTVTVDTIKNHYCKDKADVVESLDRLVREQLVVRYNHGYSLNSSKNDEINSLI